MSAQVELIYDSNCPNVQEARRALLEAFAGLNIEPAWTEWDRESPESPPYARDYGSPTVLINGRDVTGAEPADANCCRVYLHGPGSLRGVPPVSSIVAALRRNIPSTPGAPIRKRAQWWQSLTALPGMGAAFLPLGGCPACWPVYSALLGAFGLTFLLDSAYVLWLTFTLLSVALLALGFRAKARRGYGPLLLGAASAGVILFFKFVRVLDPLVYAGLSGLLIASLWNAWPKRSASASPCPNCVPPEPAKREPA